jgi:hypothetical protein
MFNARVVSGVGPSSDLAPAPSTESQQARHNRAPPESPRGIMRSSISVNPEVHEFWVKLQSSRQDDKGQSRILQSKFSAAPTPESQKK